MYSQFTILAAGFFRCPSEFSITRNILQRLWYHVQQIAVTELPFLSLWFLLYESLISDLTRSLPAQTKITGTHRMCGWKSPMHAQESNVEKVEILRGKGVGASQLN